MKCLQCGADLGPEAVSSDCDDCINKLSKTDETPTPKVECWICSEEIHSPQEKRDSIEFMGARYWFCCWQHQKQFERENFT